LNETELKQAGRTDPTDATAQPETDASSRSIWQLTEDVLELFRSRSRNEVNKQKAPGILWLDDLSETQSNTVIAIRQLCDESPDGVTLRKLAETMRVTPAAASVMVNLLVKKRIVRRTKSKNDRRAVLIRLRPECEALFDVSEQSLHETLRSVQASAGPAFLEEWRNILVTASNAMRQAIDGEVSSEPNAVEIVPVSGNGHQSA
jgi:DNA-binding MarR family transcriptional regulator